MSGLTLLNIKYKLLFSNILLAIKLINIKQKTIIYIYIT